MTTYKDYGVTLSRGQAIKIKNAIDSKHDVTNRLDKNKLTGNIMLPLTETQINKIKRAENGMQLKLS